MSLDSYLPWTLFVSKHCPLTIIDLKISQRQWTKTSLLISNHLLLRRPMGNQKSEIITPQVYKQSTESSKDEDLLFGRFRDHWKSHFMFYDCRQLLEFVFVFCHLNINYAIRRKGIMYIFFVSFHLLARFVLIQVHSGM